jgi:hypothetical protein
MNSVMIKLKNTVPAGLVTILLLFLATRVALTVIGVTSHILLEPYHGHEYVWNYSKHLWLNIWAVWDSGWYLDIAKNGYNLVLASDLPKNVDPGQANYGFFPLYPVLIAALGRWTGHYLLAGLIVSNTCILIAAWFLYKMVKFDFSEQDAIRTVKYLFFCPTAFILSGVFSESLFLMLSVLEFYFLRKRQWTYAGLTGIFLGLCRPTSVFIFPVVCLAYAAEKDYKLKNIGWNIVWLLGIPVGYGLFSLYGYCLTGDWFSYTHLKQSAWGGAWVNPVSLLAHCLISSDIISLVNGSVVAAGALVVVTAYKRAGIIYTLLGLSLLIMPLVTGSMVISGIMRYMTSVFPLFLACALLTRNRNADTILTAIFCLMQGFFMVFWSNGFPLII